MFLESLDVRRNDILIFSGNQFDFENNFNIVYKRAKVKKPEKINFFQVCDFIKDPIPKNLIVYRLLTNVERLNAFTTKFGYFIRLKSGMELIYFDPVFALKDLKHLEFEMEKDSFRFKIQQVGLTSSLQNEEEAIYTEIYSYDLSSDEAKNQNDKIYADAIFVFDDDYYADDEKDVENSQPDISKKKLKYEPILNLKTVIDEDDNVNSEIQKIDFKKDENVSSIRDEKIDLLKKALGIKEEGSKKFDSSENIAVKPPDNTSPIESEKESSEEKKTIKIRDLFNSETNLNFVQFRKDESYTLKIEDDD